METSIGNQPWQYKYTKYISEYFPEIEIAAQLHDYLYASFYKWDMSRANRFFLKFVFDFIFLVFGLIRLILWSLHDIIFKRFGLFLFIWYWLKRIVGIILLVQLYLVLFITTFYEKLWYKEVKND